MSELDRAVAELLGWQYHEDGPQSYEEHLEGRKHKYYTGTGAIFCGCPRLAASAYRPSTDANQAQAAVREWCGEDDDRWHLFGLQVVTPFWDQGADAIPSAADLGRAVAATPEQLCRALLAAAKEDKQ